MVSLITLLHDADDYKLFPHETKDSLPNACQILIDCNIHEDIGEKVLEEIGNIGYSKRLQGRVPQTPEGKAVSDADMCDGMGAEGILRIIEYRVGKGIPFFDPNDIPAKDLQYERYTTQIREPFSK